MMKCLFCALAATSLAVAPGPDVTLAEQTLQAALLGGAKTDVAILLAPGFFFVDSGGVLNDTRSFLQRVGPGTGWGAVHLLRVNTYGGAAVMAGDSVLADRPVRFLRIWASTDRGWKLVAFHITPVDASPIGSSPDKAPRPLRNAEDFIVNTTARTAAERELVESFRALETAEQNGDWASYAASTADDFQVIRFDGNVRTKSQRVEDIRQTTNTSTSFPTVSELDVQVLGGIAVMRALQRSSTSARPTLRWTRLWLRAGNRWRQAINQQTALADPQ